MYEASPEELRARLLPRKRLIQPIGPSPLGGDIHDMVDLDREGNVLGGHTRPCVCRATRRPHALGALVGSP
jgi:hypothetical protein